MIKIALLKAWLKSTWVAFVGFCRERWELLAGVLIGIFGLLALRSKDQEKALERSVELNREARDQNIKVSEDAADKVDEALEEHAQRESQIEKDYEKKSKNLDEREKELKGQILEREEADPGTIAKEINKIID